MEARGGCGGGGGGDGSLKMSVCRVGATAELRCALSVISSRRPRNNVILSRNEERDVWPSLPRAPPTAGDAASVPGDGEVWVMVMLVVMIVEIRIVML